MTLSTSPEIRRLGREEMAATSQLYRKIFDATFPWLVGLHTPEADRRYFEGEVYDNSNLYGVHENHNLVGFVGLKPGWVEKLYILPEYQGRGFGRSLLDVAKTQDTELRLWTFERNHLARRFYEANGFVELDRTDGRDNEEREPDVLYKWQRQP